MVEQRYSPSETRRIDRERDEVRLLRRDGHVPPPSATPEHRSLLYPEDAGARVRQGSAGGPSVQSAADTALDWKGAVLRVYRGINDDRILANAAAVTFYALLAVFPAIAALVSIYALFADPHSIARHLDAIAGLMPGGAVEVIRDQLDRLTAQPQGTLGISFVISLVVSLWSANGGIKALFDALNVVYEQPEERSFLRLNAVSLLFTAAMIGFFIIALACLVALPAVLSQLPHFIGSVLDLARWPLLLVLAGTALAFVYRYGPSGVEQRWRWVSWGSVFAAIGWLAVSAIFTWYAANFGTFNKTYGSLGAAIGFMMWVWLSVIVILIGGKLNAAIEQPVKHGHG